MFVFKISEVDRFWIVSAQGVAWERVGDLSSAAFVPLTHLGNNLGNYKHFLS